MGDTVHKSVMLAEVLVALRPRSGGRYADGTLGGGGHAEALLEASSPDGRLCGCDRDPEAVAMAEHRLARFAGRFELRVGNFAALSDWLETGSCDGVVLDLGVSSMQLEAAGRGFSFVKDGPLDMRMDPRSGISAAEVVNEYPDDELARLFYEYGQDRNGRKIAREIKRVRSHEPIRTTRQLASLIERITPSRGDRLHPATRVFQSLRIHVNDELGILRAGLESAWRVVKPGGRLAVISFHSLEDRIVKNFGRSLARDYRVEGSTDIPELRRPARPECRWVSSKPLTPSPQELADNPRSRSAHLRVIEKL